MHKGRGLPGRGEKGEMVTSRSGCQRPPEEAFGARDYLKAG